MTEDHQLQSLAKYIASFRADWPYPQLVAYLRKYETHRDIETLELMLIKAARTPSTEGPAAINTRGPWNDLIRQLDQAETFIPQGRECRHHPEERADRCKQCDAHARATTDAHAGADLVRQALKDARSNR